MNVLVTGGSGFIASHLVDKLLKAGHYVRIFDMVLPHRLINGTSMYVGSILDIEALRMALTGIDTVYHLAAVADVDDLYRDPIRGEAINVRGTLNVLEAARQTGIKRVIYASTIWVYANSLRYEVDESEQIRPPANLYTATKLAGEHYCECYRQTYGMETTILRYGIPYGPRIRQTAVIPQFIGNALSGKPLRIAGSGEQFRQFIYVEDLADANVRVLERDTVGKVYNLAGSVRITVNDIASRIKYLINDTGVLIEYTDGRQSDFNSKIISSTLAQRELVWTPLTSFDEGLRKTIEWYRQTHPNTQKVQSAV